jgi:UDPglucose 6-dehydrogenase
MRLVIAGFGFVGQAIHEVFKDNFILTVVDPKLGELRISNVEKVDGVICCVSTPQSDDGSCCVDNVIDVLRDTPVHVPVLIKSTISLQGYERIKAQFPDHLINFSPEFLRASSAVADMKNLKYTIVSAGAACDFWMSVFRQCYQNLIILSYPIEECIAIKYFENSFLATKLSFYNEMYDFCNAYGIDFESVRTGLAYDTRIGSSHTVVDPENGFRGWGGHCFPKDTSALLKMAEIKSIGLNTLEAAVKYNKTIHKP